MCIGYLFVAGNAPQTASVLIDNQGKLLQRYLFVVEM